MKKLLLFIVLLIPFLVNGEVEYAISHNQYYVIPESAGDDWLVGEFHANVSDTMIHDRSGSYSFSIVSGNTGLAFAINGSTGMISVNDSTQFLGNDDSDYTLGIQVSIDSESETRYAYIHVVDSANCKFIDMDGGSSSNYGDRDRPLSKVADIGTLSAGHAAFLKRGTTGNYNERVTITGTFTAANPFYLAAYGTSTVKPLIDNNNTNQTGQGVQVASGIDNVYIYDIHAKDFNGDVNGGSGNCFFIKDNCDNIMINRCEASNGGNNGEFYGESYAQISLRDCKGTNNTYSHNYKMQGSYDSIISCYAKSPHGDKTCFSLPCNNLSTNAVVCYSYSGGGGSQAITLRKSDSELAYNYCTSSWRLIYIYEETGNGGDVADNNHIHHNVLVNDQGAGAIRLIHGNGVVVNNNIMASSSTGLLVGSNHEGGIVAYNNTIIKNTVDVSNSSTHDIEFRNNIYQTISGNFSPNTNNHDYDDGDPFVDYANNDFHLDSTDATSLIDQGYSYGTSEDIDGVSIPQYGGWDKGAYEHPGGPTPTDTIVSITKISDAYEQNEAAGTFRVSRTGSTSSSLTVNLGTPGGSATLNVDYTISDSASVVISSGHSYEDITVSPDDDDDVEGTETVTLSITSGSGYTIGTSSASMNLVDYEPGSMIAHWPFEEGSGTDAEDVTVNSHDGTLTNGASFSGDAEVGSYSVILDGDNDYVGTGTIDLGSQFTICMWVKIPTSGVSSIQALCANSASGSTTDGLRILVNTYGTTDRKIIVETANGSSSNTASTATSAFAFDQWNHLAFVVDKTNGTCDIYYNGTEISTDNTIRTDFATNQTFHLGQMTNNSWTMKGNLDDVRIYDSLLSETEIDDLISGYPEVTITATDTIATEAGTTTGTLRVSRGTETSGNLTVYFSKSGTADFPDDYSLSPDSSSVTINDGYTYRDITLTPVDDSSVEGNETATLTITSSANYTIGSPSSATVTIASDDTTGGYDDMLAYWPFEEGSGTDAEDVTGNSHDGTLTNGAAFSGDAEVGSYSVILDGDNDYVGTGTIDLGSQFTICMWAKIPTTGVSSIQTLFANSASGGTTNGMRAFVDTYGTTDRKIIVETANGSSSNSASTATSAFAFDQWNHLAFVVDKTNGTCDIYYNGTEISTDNTIRTDFATNQTFHLGQMTNNSWTMKGNLDDVRIYDSLLSETEIDAIIEGETLPTVTITATDTIATEAGTTTGTFRVSRGTETSGNLTVYFSKSGTADFPDDYSLSPDSSSVTINNGNTYADVTLTPVDDSDVEINETAILTITSGSYTIGSPSSATVTIVSDDTAGSYEDPIAHWKFEQNGDDEMGTYDLTYSVDMTSYYYNSTPPPGSSGYYVSFNSGRYAYTPTINLGSEFTITGWYKTSAGGYPTLLTNTTSSANGFCLRVNNGYDRIELRTENSTNNELIATSNNSTHTDNTWVHFAAVVDRTNGTCDLYVDGTDETSSSSIRTDFKNSDPIYLAIVPAADYKLYGNMDDVRIYDYLVDADDIADIYDGTKKAHVSLDGESSQLSVFPVPFTNGFTVKGAAQIKRIEVMNICGKSILVKDNPGNPVLKVNMSSQPAGYYIMRVTDSNNNMSIKKLVKK